MVKHRQVARRIKNVIRAEDCSEIAVEAINRNLTISINGPLKQKTIIQSLVGMSATKHSVHSLNKVVEKVPCETWVRYPLLKVDLDSLLELQSKILTYSNDQILVPGKSYHFAIDFTDDPYYGEIIEANKDYVVYGIDWKPRRVYQVYKNRFAIASSYRVRNVVKAKTSSRNIMLRYLLTIISFLLKNIWVALQWMFFWFCRNPRFFEVNN
jgi:hypothetical protein